MFDSQNSRCAELPFTIAFWVFITKIHELLSLDSKRIILFNGCAKLVAEISKYDKIGV